MKKGLLVAVLASVMGFYSLSFAANTVPGTMAGTGTVASTDTNTDGSSTMSTTTDADGSTMNASS
ncbi:MAG TPA: hypothetical protein VD770_05170 [Coxiellaceae bacterium]|nr:hypothetical protein [Coxiellaceae bacterium]